LECQRGEQERKRKDMSIRPLGDKVVVKVLEAEEKTAGGIILPDSAKKKPTEGEVVAVGTGRVLENGKRNELSVKVGDRVIFSKYGGNEVTLDGDEMTILDEDQIYAIVTK
jgi:chaperonin GroES